MIRIALIIALLAGLIVTALPATAQDGTPPAGLGVASVIYNTNLQPIGEVTVLEIVDPFQDYDLANGQPARGFRWVMATVRLKAGEQPLNANGTGTFQVTDSDGFVAYQTYITRGEESVTAYPDFNGSNIPAGQEVTGAVFFQVFGTSKPEIVEYNPDYGQSVVAADLREATVATGTVVAHVANDGSQLADLSVLGVVDPLEDYDPSYAPQRGFRYVGVAISYTNKGTKPFTLDASRFSVVDREGFSYSSYGVYRTPEGEAAFPSLAYTEVAPGATVNGMVSIELINGAMIKDVLYSPTGDRRIRLAEYGPNDVYTPPTMAVVPTPTPQPTPDPACDAVVVWSDAIETALPETTAAFDIMGRATNGEQVDPQAVRDGANQIRDAAQALDDLETPEIAQAASDQLVTAFENVADQIDALAAGVEAGDQAAIQAASDAIGKLLFEDLSTGPYADLLVRCPALNE
jgi:hypothetical protein